MAYHCIYVVQLQQPASQPASQLKVAASASLQNDRDVKVLLLLGNLSFFFSGGHQLTQSFAKPFIIMTFSVLIFALLVMPSFCDFFPFLH